MSNYSQIKSYTTKDGLADSDPNKIIYGADIDGELSAISTAITSKADTATSNTFAATNTFSSTLTTVGINATGTVNATTLQAGSITVYPSVRATKTSTTSRSSTATPADDPTLTLSLAAGTYEIDGLILFAASVSGAGGLVCRMNNSGTATNWQLHTFATINGTTTSKYEAGLSGTGIPSTSASGATASVGSQDGVTFKGFIVLTTTSTLSIQWSQNSSNVNALIAQGGYLSARKVA